MRERVLGLLPQTDVLLMAAAVADFAPAVVAEQKIKKDQGGHGLQLTRTEDILDEVARLRRDDQIIVGFAAETENIVENALDKLNRKNLDLIVANDARLAMGAAANQVTLVHKDSRTESLPLLAKDQVAQRILERLVELLSEKP
jgi:phosphopantothenoylcysteine decarboxylase/phosphopantothenate--cysteine ligase